MVFLRTDIEGSMQLTRALGPRWDPLLERHNAVVRAEIGGLGGHVVRTEGDAFLAVFPIAEAAARAAVAIQQAMDLEPWPPEARIRVRVGLHAGSAHRAGDDYGGFEIARAARIAAAGSGGQIVLSDPVRALLAHDLPAGWVIRDLGWHRLRDVPRPERLHQLDVPGLPTEFPPLRTAPPEDRLPARTGAVIGREEDLVALDVLLGTARLVTLTGPGGTGKTTLAVEAAHRRLDRYADGAWFVDLAPIADAAEVPGAIARSLGLLDGATGPAAGRLAAHLRARELLLVLDNLEHLLDAAPVIAALVEAAPSCQVLVTSRAALRVRAEHEYPVRPLRVEPGATSPARTLFLERARRVAPGVPETAGDSALVDQICARLDGLPLAIELAAARCGSLSLAMIADRLARHLPLPGVAPRDLPARQRTLEATLDWSIDLLPGPVARLLGWLGVFEGSFDLEQVIAISGSEDAMVADPIEGIVMLVEQSLVERLPGPGARYRLLETVRDHALTRIRDDGDLAMLRERHALAFLGLAEAFAGHLHGWHQGTWVRRLAEDGPNLRAAMAWAIETRDSATGARMVGAAWRYWIAAGELQDALAWGRAVLALGVVDPWQRLAVLDGVGGLAYWGAELATAHAIYVEQLAVARAVGDPGAIGNAAFNLTHTAVMSGDRELGQEAIEIATAAFRATGDEQGLARLAMGAMLARVMESREVEISGMERVHDRLVELEDLLFAGVAAGSLSWFAMASGDARQALGWALRVIRYGHALGEPASVVISLASIAVFLLSLGHAEAAAMLLGAFDGSCRQYGVRPPVDVVTVIGGSAPAEGARAALGDDRFEEARAIGERLTLDDAVGLVVRVARVEGIEADLEAVRLGVDAGSDRPSHDT